MKKILLLLLLIIPFNIEAVTMDEYREAVAKVSESAAGVYGEEWVYSYFWGGTPENPKNLKSSTTSVWRDRAKKGQKSSGYIYGTMPSKAGIQGSFTNKFAVYCETYVQVIVHHASNGAVSYSSDYEKIKVSEMKRGDLIHFPNHIAIYLGPGPNGSYKVSHASGKIYIKDETRTPDYAYRLKQSSLSKLQANYIFSSYDFHDRLDDYAPIISDVSVVPNSNRVRIVANDYKHYDLAPPSDIIEPENNGIVGYQITTNNSTPTTFKKVDKTQVLDITDEVSKSGTYYIWVIDVGGNIKSKQVNLTGIVVDDIKPKLGTINSNIFRDSIFITIVGASDESGIKEYRYYLNDKLIETTDNEEILFENLTENTTYKFYYEVVDKNNNVAKSETYTFVTTINAKNIILDKSSITLSLNETYSINPRIEADTYNYSIKYSSSNPLVASVDNSGNIKALSPGETIIKVSVGNKDASLNVKVLKYNIVFNTNVLPPAYIDTDYAANIMTTPAGIVSLYGGMLPNGLRIENNRIVGKPTNIALGRYDFLLIVNVDGETKTQNFSIYVNKNESFNYIWLLLIIPVGIVGFLLYKKIKRNNSYD